MGDPRASRSNTKLSDPASSEATNGMPNGAAAGAAVGGGGHGGAQGAQRQSRNWFKILAVVLAAWVVLSWLLG